MRILVLTGPGGEAQGWGNMEVTRSVAAAAEASGHRVRIDWVETEGQLLRSLAGARFDMLWSALYHLSPNPEFIGRNQDGVWVADLLDSRQIPYIGSNSRSMREMIDKSLTHAILARAGVPVPANRLMRSTDHPTGIRYPAFVKPSCESRSVGISEDSVVETEEALRRQVAWIEGQYDQPALVEDFLPGPEYTALVLGNGDDRECLPGRVEVQEELYGRYRILRGDLRGVGLTKVKSAGAAAGAVQELAARAAEAMSCLDHVRIDCKTGADGELRILEVNGIPGLKPRSSWAPQLYTLHHPCPEGELEDYRGLIARIIASAAHRWGR